MSEASLNEAVRTRLDWLARPCAVFELGQAPVDPRQSMAGGHPYLPPGSAWPQSPSGPYAFVVQLNFADLPALPGFPTSGLLQWFVEPGDSFGLTFDETAGVAGFHVRWWDASARAQSVPVDTPVPAVPDGGYTPVTLTEPRALQFRFAPSLPEWEGLPAIAQHDPVWAEVARANGEDPEEVQLGYGEYARNPYLHSAGRWIGQVGGFASFIQEDPRPAPGDRPHGRYPAVGEPGWPLLVQLESADAWEWGDVGIAHLFGDPSAVGRGDLSSIRYSWECH